MGVGKINPRKIREPKELKTKEDKEKALVRLKKEESDKEKLEKRLKEIEEEAVAKEQMYNEKYKKAEARR